MLRSRRPVVAVTAVRTGVGKSQTTRYVARLLQDLGLRVVAVRHPMPYGDLAAQACQRFETVEDLVKHQCTIEEREEYEPHIEAGVVVYAGVDYGQILREAEAEADVVLWDGGNNDLPFYAPDLHIVLADPLRPGDEAGYHPGEANVRMADLVIVAKCDSARAEDIAAVEASVRSLNPRADVLRCDSPVTLDDPTVATGQRVVVIEDGPTLTHGSMSFGAGVVGARDAGAAEIVDPTPFAVGSIAATYAKYPNARGILPAMGYGEAQTRDLEATIRAMVDAGAIDAIVSRHAGRHHPGAHRRRAAHPGPVRAARAAARPAGRGPGQGPRPLTPRSRGTPPGAFEVIRWPLAPEDHLEPGQPARSLSRRAGRAGRRRAPARGRPRGRPRATPAGRRARPAAPASWGTRRSCPAG